MHTHDDDDHHHHHVRDEDDDDGICHDDCFLFSLTKSCHVSHSDHHKATSPSDALVNIFAKMQGKVLFGAKTEKEKVEKCVLSLKKKDAVVKGILFPVTHMVCKHNDTSSTSALQRVGMSPNWTSLVNKQVN